MYGLNLNLFFRDTKLGTLAQIITFRDHKTCIRAITNTRKKTINGFVCIQVQVENNFAYKFLVVSRIN